MSKKLSPLGMQILVLPIVEELMQTKCGLTVVENSIEKGTVVELSPELKDVYSKGDTVLFNKGAGVTQFYKGNTHFFLNGNGQPVGDVWAIEREDDLADDLKSK